MQTIMVHVTANNHAWAAEMADMSVEQVRQRYEMDHAMGVVCVIQARDKGIRNLTEHPLGHTAFISGDDSVINLGGENYYRACAEMVSEHMGCVKRVGHKTECEDFYGNKKMFGVTLSNDTKKS